MLRHAIIIAPVPQFVILERGQLGALRLAGRGEASAAEGVDVGGHDRRSPDFPNPSHQHVAND